jgi:hypothetical protein
LPDSVFPNGPAQVGFDIEAYVNERPGWLKNYHAYVADEERSGAQIVFLEEWPVKDLDGGVSYYTDAELRREFETRS